MLENCKFKTRGDNPYFIPLRPRYELLLEGEEDGETVTVLITVLHGIKIVDEVKTRVVREAEWVDEEIVEISWNYFTLCRQNGGVFYYGEDVDDFEDGEVVGHGRAWLAGVDGAKPGMIMPGLPLLGSRYFQEVAPGVALHRAEHLSLSETVVTPAGTFENCLMVEETTPFDPVEESIKQYAPGVGLVQDDFLLLVDFGFDVEIDDDLEELL